VLITIKLKNDLESVQWTSDFFSSDDPNEMWNKFIIFLNTEIKNNTHTKYITFNSSKPWINDDLLQLIKHKRRLWNKFKKSHAQQDYDIHRHFSNTVSANLHKARQAYEENLSTDPKKVYKYIRRSLNTKVSVPQLRNDDESLCFDDNKTANIFAKYFAGVFTTDPHGYRVNSQPEVMLPQISSVIENVQFTEEKIKNCICSLKSTSSPGPDGITTLLLKNCVDYLCQPLRLIMQTSFENHILPSAWKIASVTPIFKKGDKFCAENYRPISLTSVVCKVMETIISEDLSKYVVERNILPSQQHGFIRGRSVLTNLLSCVNSWTKSIDEGVPVDVVYLDFAKAFDRVSHKKLLYKLDQIGVKGNINLWIADFLKDRKFFVRVGNEFSQSLPVTSGVPQGSVLGPLLFNIYVYDLPSVVCSPNASFADDLKLFNNPITYRHVLQQDLEKIYKYSVDWSLPLNLNKCVVLHLGKNNPHMSYIIGNIDLSHVESHVDLGITITQNLTWSAHISRVCKKCNTTLFLLRKTFKGISFETSITLYKTLVRPILEYCGPVWSCDLIRDRNMLESVQRSATRLSYGAVRPSYEERLEQSGLSTFEDRRLRGDLIVTFRAIRGFFNFDLSPIFTLNRDERLRGHNWRLKKDFKTKIRENFLPNRVFEHWNGLSTEIVNSTTVNFFKNKLDVLPR
jgi:hypothetical protein